MKSPHGGFTLPDFAGQTQILLITEGDGVAWCRASGAMMVYCPVTPDRN
jgi:hypothetical protein